MSTSREHTRSIWMDVDVFPRAPLLDRDLTADTVVVGSGIAGSHFAVDGTALNGPAISPLADVPVPKMRRGIAMPQCDPARNCQWERTFPEPTMMHRV